MIGFLNGRVAHKNPTGCFLDVGGVGYRLACSATTLAALPHEGEATKLFTHMTVRDDAIALYGFASEAEQTMFEALLSVASVGPKVALAVCSAFTPERFRSAVATDDTAAISSVPGVGKKTAQRMILELKEKLAIPDLVVVGSNGNVLVEARSALENLGYSPGEVRAALGEVDAEGAKVEDVVKSALQVLA